MIIMPADGNLPWIHYLAGRYPGMLGHLYTPYQQRGPFEWLPYGLDNERYAAWAHNKPWDEGRFLTMLEWAYGNACRGHPPLWSLVPDVVANRDETLREWERWSPIVKAQGFKLAFALQDGMTRHDIPVEADVLFVGGTTAWKWSTLRSWCGLGKPVHAGRVNSYRLIRQAQEAGAVSVDGTGWLRGDRQQLAGLRLWLEEEAGEKPRVTQDAMFAAAGEEGD